MEACDLYDQGKYEACLSTLSKSFDNNPTNDSFLMNKALLDFILAKKRKLNEFESCLDRIATQSDSSGKSSSSISLVKQSISIGTLYYNLSLCYFYQRKYQSAAEILAKLLKLTDFYIGEMDSSTSRVLLTLNYPIYPDLKLSAKIIILFIDCLLMLNEYRRAYSFSSYVLNLNLNEENSFFNKNQMVQIKIFAIRSLISLGYTSTMEPEIDKILFNLNADGQIDTILANQLLFLKSRIHMVKRDINSAIKCLSSIMPNEKIDDPKDTGLLESPLIWNNLGIVNSMHQKYTLGIANFTKSIKEFENFTYELCSEDKEGVSDNLVNYISLNASKKTGTNQFDKIFKTSVPKKTETAFYNTVNVESFQVCHHFSVLYNYGLSSLFSKKFGQAFEVFQKLAYFYPKNPRVWFHLGETCLSLNSYYQNIANKEEDGFDSSINLIDFSGGKDRKLLIYFKSTNESKKFLTDSPVFLSPSLNLAILSFKNSLHSLISLSDAVALNSNANNYSVSLFEWAETKVIKLEPSSEILYGLKFLHFYSSALLMLSYSSLCIGNYSDTIFYAKQILFNSEKQDFDENEEIQSHEITPLYRALWLGDISPPNYRYLAKTYAAEAALFLKRNNLARSFLKLPNHPSRINTECIRPKIDDLVSFQCQQYFKSSLNFQSDDYIDELKTKNKSCLENLNSSQMEVFLLYNQAVVEMSTFEVLRVKSLLDLIQAKIQLATFDTRISDFQNKLSYLRLLSNLILKNSSDVKLSRPELSVNSKKLINSNYGYMTMKNRLFR